jgi:hypothetical protein
MLFHVSITLLNRNNTVLYCMNIYSSKRLKMASRHSPRFLLEQKRRKHVQEALVKETGWNDGVAGSEQRRGCVGYFAHPFVKRRGLLLFSSFFSQLWFFTDEGRKSISCIYKHAALPHPCLFRNTALFHIIHTKIDHAVCRFGVMPFVVIVER